MKNIQAQDTKNDPMEQMDSTAEESPKKSSRAFFSAEELLTSPLEEIPCLVDPILPQVGLFCLKGGSDSGKSSFFRQLSYAIVTGMDQFLGWEIKARHRRVIYVSTEDDEIAINVQLNKIHKKFEYPPSNLKELYFLVYTEELTTNLHKILESNPADLVIIDVLMDLFPGNINETNKVRYFMQGYQALAIEHHCLIGFVHHNGKRTQTLAPHKDNMLGSQGIESKARLVLELRNDPIRSGIKHLCILKGNYLPSAIKEESVEVKFDETHLFFEATGNRVQIEHLVKPSKKKNDHEKEKKREKAIELFNQGISYEEIHTTRHF